MFPCFESISSHLKSIAPYIYFYFNKTKAIRKLTAGIKKRSGIILSVRVSERASCSDTIKLSRQNRFPGTGKTILCFVIRR